MFHKLNAKPFYFLLRSCKMIAIMKVVFIMRDYLKAVECSSLNNPESKKLRNINYG